MLRSFLAACAFLFLATLPANAACPGNACFAIGGGFTMDFATDSAHWSGSTGGTTCSCEPGTNDALTFDSSSGGGTVTFNVSGGVTVASITTSSFTGTLDNSINNNAVNAQFFLCNGAGTQTLKMGSATWSMSHVGGSTWFISCTNMTLTAGTSTIAFTGTATSTRTFVGGGKTYNTVTFNSSTNFAIQITGANTFGTLTVNAPNRVDFTGGSTNTITTLTNITGSSSAETLFDSSAQGTTATISLTNNFTGSWMGFRDITLSGAGTMTASSSFNFGNNAGAGLTISAPSSGGGGSGPLIGGGL
jgi:hypothetical protein